MKYQVVIDPQFKKKLERLMLEIEYSSPEAIKYFEVLIQAHFKEIRNRMKHFKNEELRAKAHKKYMDSL